MNLKRLSQCIILIWLHLGDTSPGMGLPTTASVATISANGSDNRAIPQFVAQQYLNKSSLFARIERSAELSHRDLDEDDDGTHILDNNEEDFDFDSSNTSEPGMSLGGRCLNSCASDLLHTFCDLSKGLCICEPKYPVRLERRGCAKPKLLGDQCFYSETCQFYDSNAECAQVGFKAMCTCRPGYHTVGLQKGVKRAFCSEDIVLLHTDLPSLLVVAAGIAVLSGLLCFVLKLFSSNRYGERGHYANANLAPPLLFSSDNQWINGIPLTVHNRPSSRSSSQRSTANLAHYRSKGVLVPASRAGAARAAAILLIPCHLQAARTPDAPPSSQEDDHDSPTGSRRPSISSVHSNASSHMSYSERRFASENQQREQRAVMKAARDEAARSFVAPPTPSPISTDHLLPSCEELNEEDPLGITAVLSVPSAASSESNSIHRLASTTPPKKT